MRWQHTSTSQLSWHQLRLGTNWFKKLILEEKTQISGFLITGKATSKQANSIHRIGEVAGGGDHHRTGVGVLVTCH